ncbi:MAG: FAD/NAD(P)-binding protein [Spirochaetia bacterium]|nr:FAD/NAD(P)-binding protein [Spirochaetia bacterium]
MKTDKVYKCEITNIVELTDKEKLFQLKIIDPVEAKIFSFLPGQFVMLELPGFGEIPISISGSTSRRGSVALCIRKAGKVTNMLHKLSKGAHVGIRGPFGTHFPMKQMAGGNILLIAGGLGIAPLRAPIYYINEHRSEYENVHILYGVKTPDEIIFDFQFDSWRKVYGYNIDIIVEKPDKNWRGKTGLITELFNDIVIDPENTSAIVCGPPVMFKFVCDYLHRQGLPMNKMFVSLERRMHCGMGKCCRCMVGSTFTCVDGPVMDFWTVMNLKEAI